MVRLSREGRQILRILPMLAIGLGLIWFAACGSGGSPPVEEEESLTGSSLEQAQRLYGQLKREHSLHRDRQALDLAATLVDYYPKFAENDDVLRMAILSAQRLGDLAMARGLTDELLVRYPDSPLVDETLLKGADQAAAMGDTLAAAGYLVRYHDRDPARGTKADGQPRADVYLEPLDAGELAELMGASTSSQLWSYLGYLRVGALMADGRYSVAESVTAHMESARPDDRWTLATRDLLSDSPGVDGRPGRRSKEAVSPDQIGVLSPLSGRYSVLGNAFFDACLLATQAANAETGRTFELKVEDTGGDPVQAALAARKLCEEAGSVAVFGSLMSDPTVPAAVVCDLYGVPLVSPTATNDHIWQLGSRVFQTNITGLYEVRLLAQLATTVMLKERFAIIHPDTPEGRRHADVFTAEVEAFGGQIVATSTYPSQGTDFRVPILEVREHRPEVIFAPATVDQMVLLGPQLDFYRAGSLVLGLSNWNSPRLVERAGTVLERAVFPSDLVLFPAEWTDEFNASWNPDLYPREATSLALKTYQSMRILLDTLHASGAANRAQLAEALARRLDNRDVVAEGPESFANSVHMIRSERISAFPAAVFAESWALNEGAAADSLADSLALDGGLAVPADLNADGDEQNEPPHPAELDSDGPE